MKYLNDYKKFNEALLPSQFRKYTKEFNRERYEKKFQEFKKKYDGDRNAYRIYLPFDNKIDKSETQIEIENLFSENGYEVIDYISGIAKYKDAKNPSKIGKVLNSLSNKSDKDISPLIKKFIEDPIRKSGKDEMLICISRHPYDIAGADTDRKWTNCMTIGSESSKKLDSLEKKLSDLDKNNISDREKISQIEQEIRDIKIDGQNVKYLLQDVKEGSLIAYLIKSNDKNINNPIANLNIKPYLNVNDNRDFILLSDSKMYGNGNEMFKKRVDEFLEEFNGEKKGLYCLNKNLYQDYNDNISVFKNIDIEELIETTDKFDGNLLFTIFDRLDKKVPRTSKIYDYIIEKNINISKVLKSIDYAKIRKTISNLSDDDWELYYWLITTIMDIAVKMKLDDVIINLIKIGSIKVFNLDFYQDGIYDIVDRTNDAKLLKEIDKNYRLLKILIEEDDISNIEKMINLCDLNFTLAKYSKKDMVDFEYYIDINDERIEFDSYELYKKLEKNKNRITK